MAVASPLNRVDYTGDGSSTGPYAFAFPIYTLSDLKVYYTIPNGSPVLQTITTNYTQTVVNVPGGTVGGSITLVTVPVTGTVISLVRTVPLTQITSFTNLDKFDAKSAVEGSYDRAVMAVQQLYETISRGLIAPISEGAIAALPSKTSRASKFLGFDANGNPTTSIAVSGSVPITSGTWIPAIIPDTLGDFAITYTIQTGTWYQVGSLMLVNWYAEWSSMTHTTSSGGMRIQTLPATAKTGSSFYGSAVWTLISDPNVTSLISQVQGTTNFIIFPAYQAPGGVVIPLVVTQLASGLNGWTAGSVLFQVA